MLVTKIVLVVLSAASGVLSVPVATTPKQVPEQVLEQTNAPADLEERSPQWDTRPNWGWRVACPSPRIRQWQGNLVNWEWCQNHCGCRTKFVAVYGICRTEKFLECYHNYCECYKQIGHINP
ncbi:hypothetical protein TWF730_004462 [Orbilia blumenaviensis]|uniref:Uncharacterized protein n=1 Tax=Orbilia blumenaviensis TaxID=1796055 RepID=A0AAV9U299_9PEZI